MSAEDWHGECHAVADSGNCGTGCPVFERLECEIGDEIIGDTIKYGDVGEITELIENYGEDIILNNLELTNELAIKLNLKKDTLMKIEEKTLINDIDVTELTTEEILTHITNENAKLTLLNDHNFESGALENLKNKHKETIKKLIILLDA